MTSDRSDRHLWVPAALATLLIALLGACGGSEADATPSSAPTSDATTTASSTSTTTTAPTTSTVPEDVWSDADVDAVFAELYPGAEVHVQPGGSLPCATTYDPQPGSGDMRIVVPDEDDGLTVAATLYDSAEDAEAAFAAAADSISTCTGTRQVGDGECTEIIVDELGDVVRYRDVCTYPVPGGTERLPYTFHQWTSRVDNLVLGISQNGPSTDPALPDAVRAVFEGAR